MAANGDPEEEPPEALLDRYVAAAITGTSQSQDAAETEALLEGIRELRIRVLARMRRGRVPESA